MLPFVAIPAIAPEALAAAGALVALIAKRVAGDGSATAEKQGTGKESATATSVELAQAQARAAQEVAIAARIASSEEVDIEEFYDLSGKGGVGVTGSDKEESFMVGAKASGQKVVKRIYKFRGGHSAEAAATITATELAQKA